MQRGEPEVHHVPVRVDEAGKQGPAVTIDSVFDARRQAIGRREDPGDLTRAVVERQGFEALQLPVGADLDAIDVPDQRRVRPVAARCRKHGSQGGRCGDRHQGGGKSEGATKHARRIALFDAGLKG